MLIGYGKMGQTIEQIALSRGHSIAHIIDVNQTDKLKAAKAEDVDVAIEFTQPESAFENIKTCIENGIPVVSGTTGWLERKPEIEALVKAKNGAFFYASNFSVGVNLFFHLNKILARIMNHYPEYKAEMEEIHHTQKKDAPSGTAITLAEGLIAEHKDYNRWLCDQPQEPGALPITSVREGTVPGTHTITYTSDIDDIEIKHTAHSRQGFALGAVVAAEWLKDKKGSLGMEDMMQLNNERPA